MFNQYHLTYHICLDTNEQSDWITVNHHKKAVNKIRESYAGSIWSAWSNERYRCPRFGRIIISNNITDEIKVHFLVKVLKFVKTLNLF